MSQQAKQAFIEWVRVNDPMLYAIAVERMKLKAQSVGDIDWSGLFNNLVDTVKNVAPAILNMNTQKKVLELQIKRAEQGLPPINAADYAPTIKVSPELTPETEEAAKRIALETVKKGIGDMKPIFFGALALGAFLLLKGR